MRLNDKKEVFCLALMVEWQNTQPEDRHKIPHLYIDKRNTQTTRLAYILNLITFRSKDSNVEFHKLSTLSRRAKDGQSYLSQDYAWMKEAHPIKDNWYFEGCTSLKQKQSFIQLLTKLGFSQSLSDCSERFLADKSLDDYIPNEGNKDMFDFYQEVLSKSKSIDVSFLIF